MCIRDRINSLQKIGDYAGAKEAAKKAKLFTIIRAVGGLIISIIYLALYVFAGDATSDIVDDIPAIVEDKMCIRDRGLGWR